MELVADSPEVPLESALAWVVWGLFLGMFHGFVVAVLLIAFDFVALFEVVPEAVQLASSLSLDFEFYIDLVVAILEVYLALAVVQVVSGPLFRGL